MTNRGLATEPQKPQREGGLPQSTWRSWLYAGFRPPDLPATSRRAYRFHLAHILLYACFEGIIANAPLMAVKGMHASDVQLQLPLAMTAIGLFASVFLGTIMATRRKQGFVLVPGFAAGLSALFMAGTSSAGWFLIFAGIISIFDFAMRPGVPSIMRIIYPAHCRSHVSGTMRQWASIAFPAATLLSAALLSVAGTQIIFMIHLEIFFAGVTCLAAFVCFMHLPDRGDGSAIEADVPASPEKPLLADFKPLADRRYRRYLLACFVFGFWNLFQQGVVPTFFAHDMNLGYVQATLLIHIIPNLAAFLSGGYLTAWFERTSIWRSYAIVTLLWGLDPIILALANFSLPAIVVGRVGRGPATLGSMVIAFFTGVHSFAKPGAETSRYTSMYFLANGVSRLTGPAAAAVALSFMSRRGILLAGGLGILASSLMFLWGDRKDTAESAEYPDE